MLSWPRSALIRTVTDAASFRPACEALDAGSGVYVRRRARKPGHRGGRGCCRAAQRDDHELTADLAEAKATIDELTNRPLRIQLQARRNTDKVVAMVTGALN